MNRWKNVFRGLKERFFKKGREEYVANSPPVEQNRQIIVRQTEADPRRIQKRDPYFIQIGFDFGTSYSKCICRDVMTNKAWIYIPTGFDGRELPFLIPCSLRVREGRLGHLDNTKADYYANGLYHLKQALEKVALQQWNDSALDPYRDYLGKGNVNGLGAFVQTCAVYFLSGVLGEIRENLRRRLLGFGTHENDYLAVNLAVPVADAERPEVNHLYQKILCEAWVLADQLKGHPALDVAEVNKMIDELSDKRETMRNEACHVYPETSANVQGFVRSRTSSDGMYLFSDAGAGTVDQSVFIFSRRDGGEHLTYLHSNVIPLGSSLIERRAALAVGKTDWEELETWRIRKENSERQPQLNQAKQWIYDELSQATYGTLAKTKRKLFNPDQLGEIRVIFGGGGHCEYPYKVAVLHPFSGGLFRRTVFPDVLGMPIPSDLELGAGQARWMRRLSVAYGLSFERSELSTFTYPVQVQPPKPEEIWQPRCTIREAPTKDEC